MAYLDNQMDKYSQQLYSDQSNLSSFAIKQKIICTSLKKIRKVIDFSKKNGKNLSTQLLNALKTLPLLALSMTWVEFGQNSVRCNTLTLRLHFIELKECAKSYVNLADTGFIQVIFKEIETLIKTYETNKQEGKLYSILLIYQINKIKVFHQSEYFR